MVPVRPTTTCSHCKRNGHSVENCFVKKNEQKTCSICKLKGHSEESCRKKDTPKDSPKPSGSSGENKHPTVTCNYCKEKGHYANECPKRNVPPRAVKYAQRTEQPLVHEQQQEMEYVADRFSTQAQIHAPENCHGQNA